MLKDELYRHKSAPFPFTFNKQVAEVFSDMINRSVPGYAEVIKTVGQLTKQYAQPNTNCYDLGCSLASAAIQMRLNSPKSCEIIAIDNSEAMLSEATKQIQQVQLKTPIKLQQQDIQKSQLNNASVIAMNYTLQFIDKNQRSRLIQKIHDALLPGGLFIISEKIKTNSTHAEALFYSLYKEFKKSQGYNDLEISRKRNALEKALHPDTEKTHIQRLKRAGFTNIQAWYRHYQFTSFLAWRNKPKENCLGNRSI